MDKALTNEDFNTCLNGVALEDGIAKIDLMEYIDAGGTNLGVEIHSGRNRIIRRIFEFLGYKVKN